MEMLETAVSCPAVAMDSHSQSQEPRQPPVMFTMKRQRKLERWQFIKLIPMDEHADTPANLLKSSMAKEAYCTVCKVSIQYSKGQNTSVRQHMERWHSDAMDSFKKNKGSHESRAIEVGNAAACSSSETQTRTVTEQQQLRANKLLVIWVATSMRPLSIVDDQAFRTYVRYIARDLGGIDLKLPGRTQVTLDVRSLAEEMRAMLKRELAEGCQHYCCTTDIWTDRAQRSFICLTLHYIDNNFMRKNWTLDVRPLPGQHTGAAIADALRTTTAEWGLRKEKCVALLRDGASNGVLAGNLLDVPHFSCVAHSLHLVLGSALIRKPSRAATSVVANTEDTDDATAIAELQETACDEVESHLAMEAEFDERETTNRVRAIVQVFRSLASYFHRSPKAKYRLSKLQAENELERLEVVMDCPTRWNSCCDMLARFVRIETSINIFFVYLESASGRREFPEARLARPEPSEWFAIKCLTALLDPIWGATELLSGEGYPTLGFALPCLRTIETYLVDVRIFDDVVALVHRQPFVDDTLVLMHAMRRTLHRLFTARFDQSKIATELKWVSLLDPRLTDLNHLDAEERIEARKALVDVTVESCLVAGPRPIQDPVDVMRSPPVATSEKVKRAARSNIFGSRVRHSQPRSTAFAGNTRSRVELEVGRYLTESATALEDDDPFDWWKAHANRFPVLASVARMWLGCAATSVPSERAFSTSGNIVTARRCSLAPALVRDLVFIAENNK